MLCYKVILYIKGKYTLKILLNFLKEILINISFVMHLYHKVHKFKSCVRKTNLKGSLGNPMKI